MAGLKVLVVDDEPSILRSTSALLGSLGYEVVECGEASRILLTIARERPDLILQDVRMPGLDLDRLVLEIREKHGRLPIVLFTASMDADELCARVRANGVIEKPFRPDELLSTLEGTLKISA